MFMTKEEALTEMQELVATMEAILERAEDCEDEMEALVGEIEAQYEEMLGAIFQLKKSSARNLSTEMRNYTTLTVLEARQAIREAEAIA